ncbi:MAG: hypothetical protein BGN86_15415 [Caulobacterales bacterium 68-7]|nr:MAG: hypothetical protein BGN86_15415 [Caulobacterales bacterium 68-7]
MLDFQRGEEALLSRAITDITIRFEPDGTAGTPMPPPRWVRTLTPQSVDALFPPEARAASVATGLGTVACKVNNRGGLGDCKVVSETPTGLGFGAAALKAAEVMQINPWTDDGRPMDGRELTLPIRLTLPDIAPASPPAP